MKNTELKDYEDLFRSIAHKFPKKWKDVFADIEITPEIDKWLLSLMK